MKKYYISKSTPANKSGHVIMTFKTKYDASLYLRDVIRNYREDAPFGKKLDVAYTTDFGAVAYDGGDRIEYRIFKI